MSEYYILEGKEPVPATLLEWGKWFSKANRHVAVDHINDTVSVSTVFLGLDHQWGEGPPLLFETMIFGGPHDQYQERYSSWDEAEKGHAYAVRLALDGGASR